MSPEFAVVDLFAGPGGLAEGFSSVRSHGCRPFKIVLSVEKETSAFETLRLRSFLRQFEYFPKEYYEFVNGERCEPDWKTLFPSEWNKASHETLQLELGSEKSIQEMNRRLQAIKEQFGRNTVLIGGPPCQAYSLVGRARNKGIRGYEPRNDHRHFLYQEYIRILRQLMPAAFVMENVKGLLSSSVDGEGVFNRVLDDLRGVGGGSYMLIPLAPQARSLLSGVADPAAADFVVRAENFGIPQSRHRVIVLGVHRDFVGSFQLSQFAGLLTPSDRLVTVRDVLKNMPKLRSGLNGVTDDKSTWRSTVGQLTKQVASMEFGITSELRPSYRSLARRVAKAVSGLSRVGGRSGGPYAVVPETCPAELRRWLVDPKLNVFLNNETRGHMRSDLARYSFVALYGTVVKTSPKAHDFPRELAPDHRNWRSGKFADRFRVQLWGHPSTTITSHISKDGHYYIHPDPMQCRSLTVREAARLQTFPDNYYFKGNRTQQFVQVGNAVPPFLAKKIAEAVYRALIAAKQTDRSKRKELA